MHIKRVFDILCSIFLLILFGLPLIFLFILAYFDCGGSGLFSQRRIGQYGKPFNIYKIRTLHLKSHSKSSYGKFLRNYKLDEIPQLINILLGKMSFVGPRPDIPGYYDRLQGTARKLLSLKPGLFSRAAIKYFNEENILSKQYNPMEYNDRVIFPDKVQMNLKYYKYRSVGEDFRILGYSAKTIITRMF